MGVKESEESIIQNLKDAGCDRQLIENFLKDLQSGETAYGLKRLAVHRRTLLDAIHREQRCIDCLDYLVYQMQKTNDDKD